MDVPECKELKKKYDDCFGNWFQNVRKVEPIQCENVFQDYKDCVTIVMQSKFKKDNKKGDKNDTSS